MYLFNLCLDLPVGIKFSRNPYVFMLFLEANLLIKNLLSLYICFLFSDVFKAKKFVEMQDGIVQRTLTIRGSITVQLVSSLTMLHLTASLCKYK